MSFTSISYKKPEFFAQVEYGNEKKAPKWLVRVVFKPNITINAIYPLYKDLVKTSQLTAKKIALNAG